jgi:hypothetical protein
MPLRGAFFMPVGFYSLPGVYAEPQVRLQSGVAAYRAKNLPFFEKTLENLM